MGCPSAIAPPVGFTRGSSKGYPNAFAKARHGDANASFGSMISMSSIVLPQRASAFFMAEIGASNIGTGSPPATARPIIRTSGSSPSASALSALMSNTVAAPSTI